MKAIYIALCHFQPFRDALSLPFTKHDAVFVDHSLRDIITRYDIKNEYFWIESDNASNQYMSKFSFGLIKQSVDAFGLRIICSYGAVGLGKRAINRI